MIAAAQGSGWPTRAKWVAPAALLLAASLVTLLAVDWLPARAAAALLLVLALPGWLAARLLLGGAAPFAGRAERAVAAAALGASLAAPLVLALAYLPGAVSQPLLMGAFSALTLLLGAAVVLWASPAAEVEEKPDRLLLPALVVVLLVGGLLRLLWLGYSEFQGDEARVLLRAGELLLGYENTPFIHQKPPGELLLTAALYGLTGAINETVARLPFALANLAALAGTLLLGRRLLGTRAGLVAALLLALNGYLVAFGRIVQYQSVVFLAAVALLLILAGAVEAQRQARLAGRAPPPPGRRLLAAAVVAAGGLLFHFDMAAVALPALWLLWRLHAEGLAWGRLGRALLLPVLTGAALLLLWVLPFVRSPEFGRTFTYVAEARVGGAPPYNALPDILQRSVLYSSAYFVIVQAAAVGLGAALLVRRRWGRNSGVVASLLLAGAAALAVAQPAWLSMGGRDLSALPLAAALVAAALLPGLTPGERTVWLWFGPLAALAWVLIAVPHSHVYTYQIPLALAAGGALQELDVRLTLRRPALVRAARGAAAALALLLALYPWLLFADAPAERLRRWDEAQPTAFWSPFAEPPALAIFGFPLRNGWKAAGLLLNDGTLTDGFETNARPEVADWYTRGVEACPAPTRLWLLTETVEPTDDAALAALAATLNGGHDLLGRMTVRGIERMAIFVARDGGSAPDLAGSAEAAAAPFQELTRTLIFGRRGRIPAPAAATPLDVRFDDGLRLAGYTLPSREVAPSGTLDVTLEWLAERTPGAEYTVFLHLVDPATNAKVGQRDALPVCGRVLSWQWNAGDRIADPHRIEVAPDAPPGAYHLLVGLYTLADGARLPTLDAAGAPAADYVDLGEVLVVE